MQQNVRVIVILLESIIQGTQIKKRLQNWCILTIQKSSEKPLKRHTLIIQRNPYHLLDPSWQMYLFLLCHWNEYSLKLAYIHLPFMWSSTRQYFLRYLNKHIFYDYLFSALLKVVVLWIYKFDISYTQLVSDGQLAIFKVCFMKYVLSNNVRLLLIVNLRYNVTMSIASTL